MQGFGRSFFSALLGRPKFRYTVEELQGLHDVLLRNPVVTESNKALVVETIRSIAEFIIWGDQNDPRMFEYFKEHNLMLYLQHLLRQPAHRGGVVARQVLQTLSIIVQNAQSEEALNFVFSHNCINTITELPFDFEDEEVLGYYVTFLKTIALKLTPRTAPFLLQRHSGGAATLPLYSEAVNLAHHKEGMVRAAVRTITLAVYSVRDDAIQAFVTRQPVVGYFADVARYLEVQITLLDQRLQAAEVTANAQTLGAVDNALSEIDDVLEYCSDVFSTGAFPNLILACSFPDAD